MTDALYSEDDLRRVKISSDDGRDHTARIIWRMNRKRYLHEKRIVPMPPAPLVTLVTEKKKPPVRRKRRKAKEDIGT